MTEQEQLTDAIKDLTVVLREIKDWLLTCKVPNVSQSPTQSTGAKNVKQQADEIAAKYKCPSCQSAMVARTARATGAFFLGCSKYPDCTGSRNMNGVITKNSQPPLRAKQSTFNDDTPPEQEDVPF